MRLVHEPEDDVFIVAVLLGQLTPEGDEIIIRDFSATLSNEVAIETGKVVHVHDAGSAGVQACLDEIVKCLEVVGVKIAAQLVVHKELPANRQTEGIEAVVVDEMLHLIRRIVSITQVDNRVEHRGQVASTVRLAAEIKTINVITD